MIKKPSRAQVYVTPLQRATLQPYEIATAEILSVYFQCQVTFMTARNAYKIKTPDIEMNGQMWELKNPHGSSKRHTIKDQLKRGKQQSRNIVIDTGMTPLSDEFLMKEALRRLKNKDTRIHKLILIDKNKRVHILK